MTHINEQLVDLPASHVYDRIRKTYFGQPFGSVLASFDPQTFLINAALPRFPHGPSGEILVDDLLDTLRTGIRARTTEQQRFEFLVRETTWLHEICHFHDFACTSAGFITFAAEWNLILSIYSGIKELKKQGWVATNSLVDEHRKELRELFNLYCNVVVNRIAVFGDLEFIEVEPSNAQYDVVWGQIPLGATTVQIPFFPAAVVVDGRQQCVLVPVGFRAITECRAVLCQWLTIRTFGQEYVTQYQAMLGTQMEYRAVNMLCTRVLKHNGSALQDGPWNTDELFRLLSAVLARDTATLSVPIGRVLMEELKRVDSITGRYQGTHTENIQHMSNVKVAWESAHHPEVGGNWHGYQMRDFALSCFRSSLETYSKKPLADF